VDFMLRACCRGVGGSEMKKTIGDISHTLNLIHHPILRQREEGEVGMEEVESKLHLFGCQQKDLEKFHKVGVGYGHYTFCYQNVDNIQGYMPPLTKQSQTYWSSSKMQNTVSDASSLR